MYGRLVSGASLTVAQMVQRQARPDGIGHDRCRSVLQRGLRVNPDNPTLLQALGACLQHHCHFGVLLRSHVGISEQLCLPGLHQRCGL